MMCTTIRLISLNMVRLSKIVQLYLITTTTLLDQDRPRDPAKWSGIADVVSALSIPVIANGDVFEYDDFQHIKSATGFGIRGFVGDGCKRGHFGILQYFHLKAKFLMRIPKKNILGSASCGIMILEAPSIH